MEHLREMWKTAAGKSLKEMTKDEFARLRVVYHGTSNPADIDKLLAQGVKMSNVPNNIGRQRFERGEYAEYQPGAGVGRGLYVTSSAYTASDYGRHVIAIEVVDADLAVPPESTVPGGSVAEALKDYNGAMIVRDIPASKVHLVAKGLTHYITEDVWETAQKVGARGEFIRGVTGQVSRDVAQSIINALNGGDKAQAGKLVCDWFANSQGGYNDSGGIGSWWGPGDVRNQIVYYAEGGNLYVDPSGLFMFPSYGKTSLGILLHGTPDGDKEPGGFQFHGDVQIDSVEIYHRVGDEFSSKSSWVSCPVGKRYPMGR